MAVELVKHLPRPLVLSMVNGDSYRLACTQKQRLTMCLLKKKEIEDQITKLQLNKDSLLTIKASLEQQLADLTSSLSPYSSSSSSTTSSQTIAIASTDVEINVEITAAAAADHSKLDNSILTVEQRASLLPLDDLRRKQLIEIFQREAPNMLVMTKEEGYLLRGDPETKMIPRLSPALFDLIRDDQRDEYYKLLKQSASYHGFEIENSSRQKKRKLSQGGAPQIVGDNNAPYDPFEQIS
jgi:hypothetical protein